MLPLNTLAEAAALAADYEEAAFTRAIADGRSEPFARAFSASAGAAFLEGFVEGLQRGLQQGWEAGFAAGRQHERARLRRLRDAYAAHGTEAQQWLMAIEIGSEPPGTNASALPEDDGLPPLAN